MSKVSIVIPTYNRASVLRRSIESVVQQSFKDWELRVVDDGSTDDTQELMSSICQEYPHLSIYYIQSPNLGVSHARNLGIKLSKSPWICFLDSDDEWLAEKLEKQFQVAQTSSLPLIHTDELWIRNDLRVNPLKKYNKAGGRHFSRSVELCSISPSTVMIKASLFKEVGLFNTSFEVCEDYDMWLRVTARHNIEYLPEALIKKHAGHPDQLSQKFSLMSELRLKALLPHLQSPHISHKEQEHLLAYCTKKSQILLNGFKKHNHPEKYAQWAQKLKALAIEPIF